MACNKSTTIGSELQPQNLGVVFTDTSTIETSTVFVDTIATSNRELLLAGEYTDPHLGRVKAKAFFNVQPFNVSFNFGSNPQFISAVFALPINFSYGDTTQMQTLSVHRLTEPIKPQKVYRNRDALSYEATPIATATFRGSDAVFGRIEIPLNDDFRDAIVSLVNNSPLGALTQAQLDAFVRGFVIVPQGGEAIWGFRVTGQIPAAIEIKFRNEQNVEQIYRIVVRNAASAEDVSGERYNTQRFNHVEVDRTGTDIATLTQDYQALPADQTQEQTFIQESLGIFTKITFPYLGNFVKNQTIAVNRADLVVFPIKETHTPFFKVPRRLELRVLGDNQRVRNYLFRFNDPLLGNVTIQDTLALRVQAEGSNPFAVNNPLSVPLSNISNSYNLEITSYIQYCINGLNPRYLGVNKIPNNGLLISSNLSNTAVYRLVMGSNKHPRQAMKLRVFYTVVR
ncbi:MAG: hypothetical protein OHK0045_16330 [Raineya sp.]